MFKSAKTIKLGCVIGICALAITGCSQSYNTGNGQLGYGHSSAAGGYDYASGQSSYGFGQEQSGYGGIGYGQTKGGSLGYGQSSGASLGYGHSMGSGFGYGQSGFGGLGYDQSVAYGYNQVSYGYGSAQQNFGQSYSGSLRGGMMAVVPIYPVYQIATYQQVSPVQTVEVPTITLEEPQSQSYIISEPEISTYQAPQYEPMIESWPEPATPITTWAPKRK